MTTIEAMKQADYVLASVVAVSPDSIAAARTALQSAIKREEAQTVAPVAWIRAENVNQAGLTSCTVKTTKPERDGYVPLFTQPALPTTGEPAKQLASGMTMGDLHDRCCDALKRSEREELIKNLREASYSIDGEVADHITETVIKAADMLAADAQEVDWKDMYFKQKREKEAMAAKYEKDIGPLAKAVPVEAQQVTVPQTMKVSTAPSYEFANGWNACVATMLAAAPQPPQVDAPRVPMTDDEINIMYGLIPKTDDVVIELVRATEAYHKIGVKL